MADRMTPEQRRRCMQANRAKDTQIERMLGRELWHRGLRYRKNDRTVAGSPDFSFKRRKLAVFCDGEFWHGRNWDESQHRIKSNQQYWRKKIEANQARDCRVNAALAAAGWRVLRFWESDIRKRLTACADEVEAAWRQTELNRLHRAYARDTRYEELLAAEDIASYGRNEE